MKLEQGTSPEIVAQLQQYIDKAEAALPKRANQTSTVAGQSSHQKAEEDYAKAIQKSEEDYAKANQKAEEARNSAHQKAEEDYVKAKRAVDKDAWVKSMPTMIRGSSAPAAPAAPAAPECNVHYEINFNNGSSSAAAGVDERRNIQKALTARILKRFATGMNGDEDLGQDLTMKGHGYEFRADPYSLIQPSNVLEDSIANKHAQALFEKFNNAQADADAWSAVKPKIESRGAVDNFQVPSNVLEDSIANKHSQALFEKFNTAQAAADKWRNSGPQI